MNQAEQASNVIEVWIAMNEDGNYEVGRRDTKCASHPRRKVGRSPIRPNLGLKLAGGCSACAPRGAKRHAQSAVVGVRPERAGRSAARCQYVDPQVIINRLLLDQWRKHEGRRKTSSGAI